MVRGGAKAAAPAGVAKWLVHELPKVTEGRDLSALPFGADALAKVVDLVETETISTKGGRQVLEELATNGGDPAAIVKAKGLEQVSDTAALGATIDAVLAAHPNELARYRDGKKNLMGFFMGKVMQSSGGKADPKAVSGLLRSKLDG